MSLTTASDDELERQAQRKRTEEILAAQRRELRLEPLQRHIKRVMRVTSTPPVFRIETTGLDVTMTTGDLYNQKTARPAIIGAIGQHIEKMTPDEWEDWAAGIVDQAEDEEAGLEDSPEGRFRAWIEEYMHAKTCLTGIGRHGLDDPDIVVDLVRNETAYGTGEPFLHGGDLYIFGTNLRSWLWTARAERVTPREMSVVLRAGGCVQRRPEVKVDGERRNKAVWLVPTDYTYTHEALKT